jgi:hypothetical protein
MITARTDKNYLFQVFDKIQRSEIFIAGVSN